VLYLCGATVMVDFSLSIIGWAPVSTCQNGPIGLKIVNIGGVPEDDVELEARYEAGDLREGGNRGVNSTCKE
jgi:hypothetical protein